MSLFRAFLLRSTSARWRSSSTMTPVRCHLLIRALTRFSIITALSTALTLGTLASLDPHNPKASGRLSSEAAAGAAYLGALLVGLVLFSWVRILLFPSAGKRSVDEPEARADRGEGSWRTALAKAHSPAHLRPRVAWPTIALAAAGLGTWIGAAWLGHTGLLSTPFASLLCTVGIFLCFTPMHDAVHGAVAPKWRTLNTAVGMAASLPFVGMYRAFRLIHLAHHAHLNESELDPDHWAGAGPLVLLPLRWATGFYYYVSFAIERSVEEQVDYPQRKPGRWRNVVELDLAATPAVYMTVLWWVWDVSAVAFWLFPFVGAATYLLYTFDYLPHRPHKSLDQYLATSVTTGVPSPLLSVLLLSQNMHNIHHLAPSVPFYRYGDVWHICREELLKSGTRQLPWVLWPTRERHLRELGRGGGGGGWGAPPARGGPGGARGTTPPSHAHGTSDQVGGRVHPTFDRVKSHKAENVTE